MSAASKLKTGGEDRVEIASASRECSTHHAGGNKAVDGNCMLGFLHSNESGANSADPSGNPLNDGTMKNWNSKISGADIVDRIVSTPNVSLSNLNRPQNLDQSETFIILRCLMNYMMFLTKRLVMNT